MYRVKSFVLLFTLFHAGLTAWSQSITVLTYNIRFDNPADGPDAWPQRRDMLAAQIRFHDPDIFGVQEGLFHQVRFLNEALPDYAYTGVGRDDGKTAGEFAALFYRRERFERIDAGDFWLSDTPEKVSRGWDAALPRICTWVRLADRQSGDTLLVMNTHFDHIGSEARERSAALLLQFIADRATKTEAVVLMGDFNCTPDEPPYERLAARLDDTWQVSEIPPFGPAGTFNGFIFNEPVTNRIDYIFVGKNQFRTRACATLSDNRDCRYPSDHLPVLARLIRPVKKP